MAYLGNGKIKDEGLKIQKRILSAVFISGLLNSSIVSLCVAREWYVQPSASLRGLYDDNLLMRQEKFEVYGGSFTAGSKFGMRTETSNIGLTAQAIVNRYDAPSNIDNENYHFNLDSSFNITENNLFALNGRYFMDNSIVSEFDTSGLTQNLVNRTNWSIEPSWTYRLTETQNLIASYSHEVVDFEETDVSFLNSYQTDMASLNYTIQWTERLQWFTSASYLRFETPDSSFANQVSMPAFFPGLPFVFNVDGTQTFTSSSMSDMYSIQTGVNYNHSETWSSNVMIGGRWTESESSQTVTLTPDDSRFVPLFAQDTVVLKDSSPGYLLSVGTNKQFERSSIGASFFQDVRPTAQGQLMQFTGVTLNGDYQLTEHLKFSLNASATQQTTSTSEDETTRYDRDFFSIEPKLTWRVDRQMSLAGGYRYRWQEFAFDTVARESNSLYLQLNYNWDPFTTSRY